ncbi:MAG: hypothetical protein Nk1A_8270 [Endomicrobiia bacterium]|nr:MAG: hypothetical protein Nk1A_8270 [Endomicrobiia bacterium]
MYPFIDLDCINESILTSLLEFISSKSFQSFTKASSLSCSVAKPSSFLAKFFRASLVLPVSIVPGTVLVSVPAII